MVLYREDEHKLIWKLSDPTRPKGLFPYCAHMGSEVFVWFMPFFLFLLEPKLPEIPIGIHDQGLDYQNRLILLRPEPQSQSPSKHGYCRCKGFRAGLFACAEPLLVDRRADVAPHEVLVFVPALEVQGGLVESTTSMSYHREKKYQQMVKRILKQMLMERWTNSAQYGTTPGAC